MKKIFDIILGFIFASSFIVIGFPGGSYIQENWRYWIGTAIGLGTAYTISVWDREKIDKLEEEIKKFKEQTDKI